MTRSVPVGEVRPLGDRALLIGVADAAAARLLARELVQRIGAAADVVCGSATVMVHASDPDVVLSSLRAATDEAAAELVRRSPSDPQTGPGRPLAIPTRFDGPDLGEVADLAGCRPDEVVALLTDTPLTAAVIGFSPGFAYLEGLPHPLDRVPRRPRPRAQVPAGSVAIANGHAAVYPTASPGGWHLVGRTGVRLFAPEHPPYAVLAPGDTVRFTVAGPDESVEPPVVTPPPWSLPPGARAVFDVVAPGLRAVVQDRGRRAVAPVGVPAAGPADPVSFELANRLVGNEAGAATLEVTAGGLRLRCLGRCHVAAVGGAPELRLDGTVEPAGQLLPLAPGQVLEVHRLRGGCRSYVSVAGGFVGPVWFGSSSTDDLTGLGAGPLVAGDRLHAGGWAPPLGDHLGAGRATELDPAAPVRLRVLPGPHAEQFEAGALARLTDDVFVVEPTSNRVGIRLRAESTARRPRGRSTGGELDSHGVVTGAVQVPPDGEPVVLMPDHATLGGYPVLAVVAAADHGLLGQCAPGTRVRLAVVEPGEADEAWRAARRAAARAVVGTYPLAVD